MRSLIPGLAHRPKDMKMGRPSATLRPSRGL